MQKTLNFIIKISVYGLVLLIPLFFLPWTMEPFEFNKQYLLFFLVGLAFLAWLAKMIVCRKEIRFKTTALDLWILIFAVVLILGAVFSKDRVSSWLGSYGRFSDSAIGLLCLLVLYFILTNEVSFGRGLDSRFHGNDTGEAGRARKKSGNKLIRFFQSFGSGNNGGPLTGSGHKNDARSGNNPSTGSGHNPLTQFILSLSKDSGNRVCLGTILRLAVLSFWVAAIAAYFSVFGLWQKIPKFSWLPEIMKLRSFNPTGASLEGLAVFLVFAVSLIIGIVLKKGILGGGLDSRLRGNDTKGSGNDTKGSGNDTKKNLDSRLHGNDTKKNLDSRLRGNDTKGSGNDKKGTARFRMTGIFDFVGLVLAMFLLILIDFNPAWLVLAVTMFIFLAVALWTRLFKKRVNVLLLPIAFFIVSVLFAVGLPKKITVISEALSPIQNQLPRELILDHQTNFSVVWQTFRDNPILGSGPATYLVDFTKYKPNAFNESEFWNIRFDRAPGYWTETFAFLGGLGVLSYLAVIVFFFLLMFVLFSRKRLAALLEKVLLAEGKGSHPVLIIPLILGWLSLFVGQIFYYQNAVLGFFFWVFTALTIAAWYRVQGKKMREIKFTFERLPEAGLILNVILMLLAAVLAGLFYSGVRFYWADVKFSRPADNLGQLTQNVEKAAVLNKNRENYRRALSQIYLNGAWQEIKKPQAEQDVNLIQSFAGGALQQARLAADLSPNSVVVWENLGAIYRDSFGLVSGVLPFALDAFSRATELEPANPINFRELCRLNLISEEKEKDWDKIMGYCQRAVDLKQNYLDAHIQLALAYEQKGEVQEAIKKAESVLEKLRGVSFQRGSALAGAATEIYFQLGRLHFGLKDIDRAIAFFEQAVIVTPGYANGRYGLALAYQNKGRKSEALEQLKIVDQLAPGNENIKKAIEEMEK